MLEYKKPDKRYTNPKTLYIMVIRHNTNITETPCTQGYLEWLQAHGFNVPPEWKSNQHTMRVAA
jgi:hypothetical protein